MDPAIIPPLTESEPPMRAAPDRSARLLEMQRLLVAGDGLEDFLQHVAALGAAGMPPDTSCAIAVELPDGTPIVAGSDDDARTIGTIDCTHREGPCTEVRGTGRPIHVPDLAREPRRWASAVEALARGFHGWLTVPVRDAAGIVGTITLYARRAHAFDDAAVGRTADFAGDIATIIAIALKLNGQTRLNDDLRSALASRSVIDQALGVLMAENRCDRETAFGILRSASQNRNAKLREVAAGIIHAVTGEEPSSGPFHPRR